MAIALVAGQHASKDTSGTSTTISFPSASTTGNLLILGERVGGTSTAAVTDGTNTWNIDVSLSHASFGFCYINSAPNATSVTTLTVTLTGGSATIRICIAEFDGFTGTISFDQQSSLFTAFHASPWNSGNTPTTTDANELLVGFIGSNNIQTFTAGTSQAYALTDVAPASPNSKAAMEYVVVSATGAYQADISGTQTDDMIVLIATYKGTAATDTLTAQGVM